MLSKWYQVLIFPSFLYTKEKSNTTNNMVITIIHSLCQMLAHQQKLSATLSSPCVHLCFLICVIFYFIFFFAPFGGMFIFQSLYLGIIIKPYSFFFSHIQAVHPKHFKILLFLPVLVLKAVTSFLFLKPKNLILTSLSIAACSPLLLNIYSVVKPHKWANKVPVFQVQLEFVH